MNGKCATVTVCLIARKDTRLKAGVLCATDTHPKRVFSCTAEAQTKKIGDDTYEAFARFQAVAPGDDYNVAVGTIVRIMTPNTGFEQCTNPVAAYDGKDPKASVI